ncbi:MAG: metallophosphoesterase, partial [Kiritimatiellae bacterium]|nr:metallophosphoesterase [Kiritimatiellia bacterium]
MAASMGAARVLRAESGIFSGGTPNLVLGIVTDIHLSIGRSNGVFVFNGEGTFRSTLEWFRDRGVDGVVICGDMADNGLVEELQAVARVWYEVFPNDLAPDGHRVERLFVYGNHDYEGYTYGTARNLFGDSAYDHSINKDLAAAWQSCFNEAYTPVWRKDVKGYSFVGAHWIADHCRGWDEVGVPQMPDWFTANGATLDPSKPFFYIQHPPPKNTCHCDWVWGHDNGAST